MDFDTFFMKLISMKKEKKFVYLLYITIKYAVILFTFIFIFCLYATATYLHFFFFLKHYELHFSVWNILEE